MTETERSVQTAHIDAVLAGTMPVERLNVLERAAFLERLPETFALPAANLVAAYASLSDDGATGAEPATGARHGTELD